MQGVARAFGGALRTRSGALGRFFAVVAAVLAFASVLPSNAAAKAAAAKPSAPLKLIDLTGEFERVWSATVSLPDDKRASAFETEFARILPCFYDPKRVADYMPEERYQARLLERLKTYPKKRAGIARVSREFAGLIGPAQRSFEKAFGPMRGYPPIYLVNSLGEFDGGTRDLPEGNRLMFGADVIDKLYRDKPIQPFFHHELFHLLHARTFKACDQVWCNLWSEGLAVYVASRLNPGADDAALLLTSPEPLRPAVESHKQEAVCAVRERLNSTDPKDIAPLFIGSEQGLSKGLPTRFGYYVGYLVAKDLGRNRSLRQLAALSAREAKPLVAASLGRMASCPSVPHTTPQA